MRKWKNSTTGQKINVPGSKRFERVGRANQSAQKGNPPVRQSAGQAYPATPGRVLESKRDEAWHAYDVAAKKIEVQKDGLLD
jgi:hypothetical protein